MPSTSTTSGTTADSRRRRFSQPTKRLCQGDEPGTAGTGALVTAARYATGLGTAQGVTMVPAPASVKTSTSRL